ncbi:MAG: DNA primase DnaG [Halobacteria archaeon]
MQPSDTTKYFIHAKLRADGVVERSDVVGAIFGQTEGLLGSEMDLRDLQESGKVSRMDVTVESANGKSYGTITIGSSLDRVETSVLGASLETIDRIGPCEAYIEIELIEDVRTTKRKEVVDRAKHILTQRFDDSSMTTQEILDEVRETVKGSEVVTYCDHPAGPNVSDSEAILVVEGRSDVLNLLQYGIKNTVAVEGTDISKDIAELTEKRTVTAFLDSDRGGDLILKELDQVAELDFVAWPPKDKCVEDLNPKEITDSLKDKIPVDVLRSQSDIENGLRPGTGERKDDSYDGFSGIQGSVNGDYDRDKPEFVGEPVETETSRDELERDDEVTDAVDLEELSEGLDEYAEELEDVEETGIAESFDSIKDALDYVEGSGSAVLLDDEGGVLEEEATDSIKDKLRDTDSAESLIIDGEIEQSFLDVAAKKDLATVAGSGMGYVAKKPLNVNIVTSKKL